MFHYRLIHLNKNSRMLIAAFMAIAIHLGLMKFEFPARQFFVPNVSLPRSVSVTLVKRSPNKQSQHQKNTEPNKNTIKYEIEQTEKKRQLSDIKKNVPQREKRVESLQPSEVLAKAVLQPVESAEKNRDELFDDTITVPSQEGKKSQPEMKSENPGTTKSAESALQAEPQTADKDEGAVMPGTVQLAYPRYQSNDPPLYPGLSRKRGQEGTVNLQVLVNKQGRVEDLEIENSSGFGLLDRAALSAVRKWDFEPGRQGEERIAMWVRVPVTFKLKN